MSISNVHEEEAVWAAARVAEAALKATIVPATAIPI